MLATLLVSPSQSLHGLHSLHGCSKMLLRKDLGLKSNLECGDVLVNVVSDDVLVILEFLEIQASLVTFCPILGIYLFRISKYCQQTLVLISFNKNQPDFGDFGDFCPFGVFGECRCSGLDPDDDPDDGLEIAPDDGLDDKLELDDGLEGLEPLLELLELELFELELELLELDESELDDEDEDDDDEDDDDDDEDDEAENNPEIPVFPPFPVTMLTWLWLSVLGSW